LDYPPARSGYRKADITTGESRSADGKGFPVTDTATTTRVRAWAQRQAEEYRNGEDRPLDGYLKLIAVYATGTAGAFLTAKKLGRDPARLTPWDAVQLSVATHRLSRTIAKDPVTSPLRAPFTVYQGVSAPSELHEEVRSHNGVQHSVGELLTCPMCLAQWVATGFTMGLVFAPTATRTAMSIFTAVAGADFLQYAYAKLQQATA
jgi:uncharacterized protein DUF1360